MLRSKSKEYGGQAMSRMGCWAALFMGALAGGNAGCATSEEPPVAVDSLESALDESPEPSCSIEEPPLLIGVSVDEGDEADRQLSAAGQLSVDVRNDRAVEATMTVSVRALSQVGATEVSATRVTVPAQGSSTVGIDLGELGLPEQSLDFSGSISIWADADYADGDHQRSTRLHLYFHPAGDGWRVYGRQVRDNLFDGGALNRAARDLRLSEAAAGADAVIASPNSKVSDSVDYQPPLDVPAIDN